MSDIEAKSYRYLRMTIVLVLFGIGAAVWYQTYRQGFHLLGSVSAYYYTPAQTIFVGGLVTVGACMIALKGTTEFEDVVLNVGGILAAVVAIVPSTRGEDFETAVRACEQQGGGPLLTQQASGVDCPTVQALADAIRANVENSMVTLLFVGFLALVVTVAFVLADRRSNGGPSVARFFWGFGVTLVLWALGGVALLWYRDWFIRNGHYVAGGGLFACILIVTLSNAVRRQGQRPGGSMRTIGTAVRTLFRWPLDPYAWIAWAMMIGIVVTGPLYLLDVITLYWVENLVALLFVAFWLVQTVELVNVPAGARAEAVTASRA